MGNPLFLFYSYVTLCYVMLCYVTLRYVMLLRERARAREGEGQRERERILGSTPNTEPNIGLDLTTLRS